MIKYCLILIYFLLSTIVYSQESIITGLILDENNLPVQSVNISFGENIGSISDENGYYKLKITSDKIHEVIFTHINFEKIKISVQLDDKEVFEFNPVLSQKFEQISEVVINSNSRTRIKSILNLSPKKLILFWSWNYYL